MDRNSQNTHIENLSEENPPADEETTNPRSLAGLWEVLLRSGLGDTVQRITMILATCGLAIILLVVMQKLYLPGKASAPDKAEVTVTVPTPSTLMRAPEFTFSEYTIQVGGIVREAVLHTVVQEKPRMDILNYQVVTGDTIFGIAKKFNLRPDTILFGNYNVLADDPHRLKPGQKLKILPINGAIYEWHAGDGLNGVAKYFKVKPEDIISWPGNNFSPTTIGDWSNPNIKPGMEVIVPGGKREFITWSAPRITRANPSVAKILGPGACSQPMDGPIGIGTFVWPTSAKYISGYDFSPDTNHFGIDIGGKLGNPIFTVDNGVVVYAGWNDWGYGNVVVVDHGNGWQTLYAHLSVVNVNCLAYVFQGQTIGFMGSTGNSSGPHLHFEMRSDKYGRPDPKNFLAK